MAEDSDAEELLAGPRLPRWVVPAVGMLVVALVLGLVVVKLGGSDGPSAPASSTAVAVRPDTPVVPQFSDLPTRAPFEPGTLGPDVARVATLTGAVSDVVTDGDRAWYASGPYIVLLRGTESQIGGPGTGPGGLRLALDRSNGLLWSYVPGHSGATLTALRASDLRVDATFAWPRPITTAAALDGWLYVSDTEGVWAVHPNGDMPTSPLVYGIPVHALAADPHRHRILMLIDHDRTRFATLVVGPALDFYDAPVPLRSASITVTSSGAIWLAGANANGAVLDRLDPRTFEVVGVGNVVTQLGPAVSSAAAGDDALLVGGQSGQLWCVDGSDGSTLQRFAVSANRTALTTGGAFATADGSLYRLRLKDGCTG